MLCLQVRLEWWILCFCFENFVITQVEKASWTRRELGLNHGNNPPHIAAFVQQYLSKCNIKILSHSLTVHVSYNEIFGCFRLESVIKKKKEAFLKIYQVISKFCKQIPLRQTLKWLNFQGQWMLTLTLEPFCTTKTGIVLNT